MKQSRVIDPAEQTDRTRVWFGATVTIADQDDSQCVVTLVGDDESDASVGRIGWTSPMARALRGCTVSDVRRVAIPSGEREWEIMEIAYVLCPSPT